MTNKNKTEVYIYGSRYTVSGAESEEYMHKLSLYVDKKMREFSEVNNALSSGMISVLAAINIADDYFKTLDKLVNITKNQHIQTELMEKEYKQKVEELTLQIQKFQSGAVTMEEALTSQANEFEKKEKSLKEQIELLRVESAYKDEAIANQLEELANEHTQNKEELKDQINKLKDENVAKEQSISELVRKFEQLESEYKQMEELYQEEYNRIKSEYGKL
ncbi:cell division protein ZapA [Ruminiclostridium papyrosolvens]|uniref:Cell division protein ZapA n=1 Tax=Ruminiclostridium papyrosolvens C7 TaxID=1330534 RepID=U4R685_9FIRM|nr:cell division protein ZapA [Ruminiclostridium papyrosolvens]EPR13968.1 hypothetical protein L323_01805 [Ruminiclostridium papyrosolvens C7]